ncbi:hypothetical protein ACET3Z_019970 [Daucus carota]
MKNAELIFIPAPVRGHLISMVELAKLLISRNQSLSVTIFIMKFPYDTGVNSYIESLETNPIPRLAILEVPLSSSEAYKFESYYTMIPTFIDSHVTIVKNAVMAQPDRAVAALVLDVFCVSMIDMAKELNIPSYVYFTSGASYLGVLFHLQGLTDYENEDIYEYKDSDAELSVCCFNNRVPAKSLVADDKVPSVYAVGPNLNLTSARQNSDEVAEILKWLDGKPVSSVVFLCFGSFGSFTEVQMIESKIREVMKDGSEIRKRVSEMKGKSRAAVAENGSSYISLGRLIEDIIAT